MASPRSQQAALAQAKATMARLNRHRLAERSTRDQLAVQMTRLRELDVPLETVRTELGLSRATIYRLAPGAGWIPKPLDNASLSVENEATATRAVLRGDHSMTNLLPARQGDVQVVPFAGTIPARATEVKRDAGRVVLAYGEVTGHAHAILDPRARLFELTRGDVTERFLEIVAAEGEAGPALLEHEEHATIQLTPGVYKVTRQREYEPESSRYVAD